MDKQEKLDRINSERKIKYKFLNDDAAHPKYCEFGCGQIATYFTKFGTCMCHRPNRLLIGCPEYRKQYDKIKKDTNYFKGVRGKKSLRIKKPRDEIKPNKQTKYSDASLRLNKKLRVAKKHKKFVLKLNCEVKRLYKQDYFNTRDIRFSDKYLPHYYIKRKYICSYLRVFVRYYTFKNGKPIEYNRPYCYIGVDDNIYRPALRRIKKRGTNKGTAFTKYHYGKMKEFNLHKLNCVMLIPLDSKYKNAIKYH
jgi:hypothetical protein